MVILVFLYSKHTSKFKYVEVNFWIRIIMDEEHLKAKKATIKGDEVYLSIGGDTFRINYEDYLRKIERSEEYESLIERYQSELEELIKEKGGTEEEEMPPEHEWISSTGHMDIYANKRPFFEIPLDVIEEISEN